MHLFPGPRFARPLLTSLLLGLAPVVTRAAEPPPSSGTPPAFQSLFNGRDFTGLDLYLAPKREPDLSTLDLPLGRLARRWLLRGVFARDTRKAAHRALDAAERLDVERALATRRPPA